MTRGRPGSRGEAQAGGTQARIQASDAMASDTACSVTCDGPISAVVVQNNCMGSTWLGKLLDDSGCIQSFTTVGTRGARYHQPTTNTTTNTNTHTARARSMRLPL